MRMMRWRRRHVEQEKGEEWKEKNCRRIRRSWCSRGENRSRRNGREVESGGDKEPEQRRLRGDEE